MSKAFLFQAIPFNISILLVLFNPSIGPLSGATTPGQGGRGSDRNKGVFRISQSSSITGTSPSDDHLTGQTIFWVFGMMRPRIEPRSSGRLVNILTIMPMSRSVSIRKYLIAT